MLQFQTFRFSDQISRDIHERNLQVASQLPCELLLDYFRVGTFLGSYINTLVYKSDTKSIFDCI